MKEGVTFILAVVLLLLSPCRGDAVRFIVKAKVLCLVFQMSTQQKISGYVIFTTLFQTSTMQIFECVQCILRRIVSWSWERVAYNVNTINGCDHYKVGQFQRRKDSLTLLTCKYVSILKEFATDYSNASFEQCRVVLVLAFLRLQMQKKHKWCYVYAVRHNA